MRLLLYSNGIKLNSTNPAFKNVFVSYDGEFKLHTGPLEPLFDLLSVYLQIKLPG